MTFAADLQASVAAVEAQLLHMATLHGWREYAEHRAAQLAARDPGLYSHLPATVNAVKKPLKPAFDLMQSAQAAMKDVANETTETQTPGANRGASSNYRSEVSRAASKSRLVAKNEQRSRANRAR